MGAVQAERMFAPQIWPLSRGEITFGEINHDELLLETCDAFSIKRRSLLHWTFIIKAFQPAELTRNAFASTYRFVVPLLR